MNYDHILVRYGELTLKTGNRNMFVNKLKANIKSLLMPLQGYKVRANRDRMYIDVHEGSDIEEMMSRIQTAVSYTHLDVYKRQIYHYEK